MNSPDNHLATRLADYNNADSLIYGIGNIGRQDDGLGWAFIDWLEDESVCPKAELTRHYQLHLEDADRISYKKKVLFIDASKSASLHHFQLDNVKPKMDFSFTSHTISVESILATCKTCFDTTPQVQFLTIKGYEWELQLGLTAKAKQNLQYATEYFRQHINNEAVI